MEEGESVDGFEHPRTGTGQVEPLKGYDGNFRQI